MQQKAEPEFSAKTGKLAAVIEGYGDITIALSGGVDSMTLSSFAHRRFGPGRVTMVHAVSPAVPAEATARVRAQAAGENWRLELVDAGEFGDERYRANPLNRCFFCKSNLYQTLAALTEGVLVSGTNSDDLGDFRPGLEAAADHAVKHPYVEAGLAKSDVRRLALELDLPKLAALPASPCLASRVETGIRIDAGDMAAIDKVETRLRRQLAPETVRCRVRPNGIVIELDDAALHALTPDGRADAVDLVIREFDLTPNLQVQIVPYRQGSAFVGNPRMAV